MGGKLLPGKSIILGNSGRETGVIGPVKVD